MEIKIKCKGAAMMPLKKIVNLQGPLKELSKENYARLKHSLIKHGFSFPLNIATIKGKPYGVIDGHQRHKVVKQMLTEGFTLSSRSLPITLTSCKSKKEAKELILQAVSQYGKITEDGLAEFLAQAEIEVKDLEEYDLPDFDIDEFLESQGYGPEPKAEPSVPDPPNNPVTKLGDLWLLRDHKLLCGDATKAKDVDRLMNGQRANMVFTDPPYGINVVGKDGNIGGGTKSAPTTKFRPVIGDNKEFDPLFCLNHSKRVFLWGGNYFAHKLPKGGRWFVWDKNRPEGLTLSDCELAWSNIDGVQVKKFKCTWDGYHKEGESGTRRHPTQKPIKLLSDILLDVSDDNDIILDLFGGSGSTLLACEQTNRSCRMMEIDPAYCDVIVDRWQEMTGDDAVRQK